MMMTHLHLIHEMTKADRIGYLRGSEYNGLFQLHKVGRFGNVGD